MQTSSITKNFVVSGTDQIEKFADAIEESYKESLNKNEISDLNITHLREPDAIKRFIEKRKNTNS
ncbi:MAG: hypothetical protein PHX08_09225 [Lachnospiraceae bacterium]|nr:hypothetical protein [Lachnospiraceae bacterium]